MDTEYKLRPYQPVFDPLYGYIPLSEAEFRIVRSPLFQRLGQIRQLGFAHVLFPSATHTRLSHSLGVLRVVQRMIDSINANKRSAKPIAPREKALLRFAALLHDVGHLPLSHVGEKAYVKELSNKYGVVAKNKKLSKAHTKKAPFEAEDFHEQLSARIIEHDKEIAAALHIHNSGLDSSSDEIEPTHIADLLLKRGRPDKYGHLIPFIKSGLDADRLDFLMRDSYFVGSNYGKIEQDTLIQKLYLVAISKDDEYELCLEEDAALIADHFLLSRFYWYSIILANPRFQFIDLLTKNVMGFLFERKHLPKNCERLLSIPELHAVTRDLKDEDNRHKLARLQDSQVVLAMRQLHECWQNKPPAGLLQQEINTSIKVLMGGNLSHKFQQHQGLMEKSEFERCFEEKEIEKAEGSTLKKIISKIPRYRGFIKAVFRANDVHRAIPNREPAKGKEFHRDWHGQVLIGCQKKDFPACLPLVLSDTNLSHRVGRSRPKQELKNSSGGDGALTNVTFAVFALWPNDLTDSEYKTIDSIIQDQFSTFIKPLEEKIYGHAGPASKTHLART